MITLVAAVFLASLLGSLHCVGMCGAFLFAIAGEGASGLTQAGYHLGRLLTYVTLGAIAGALGSGLNIAGAMAGLQPIAVVLSAIAIIAMGTLTWLRLRGVPIARWPGPRWMAAMASKGYRFAMRRPPLQRAFIVGLLTTLLPCGWLWTFLVTAAGTAKPTLAALTMLVFWLGTLPAMAAVGAGLRGVLGKAQHRLPTLTCGAMIAVGLITLVGRARLDPLSWNKTAVAADAEAPCCKEAHADAR